MGLKRREFLQRASSVLAALGMSEALLWRAGDRYLRALAEPNSRKLALLVGVNQYSSATALAGCVTDVELQQELLIYRFGFQPADILTLTDNQATRQNIEDAFVAHLIEQAGADDLVVIHFSGFGRRFNCCRGTQEQETNSLVPVDGILAPDATAVNDILEETLRLVMHAIASDRVVVVLDTSYAYPGTAIQGNLRIRSRPSPLAEFASAEELTFQQQLQQRIAGKPLLRAPGAILAAAGSNQQAGETQWSGFSCGLFTYALTQSLWLATPATTLHFSLQQAACTLKQLVGAQQQPQWKQELGKQKDELILSSALNPMPAEGAVTAVAPDGKTVQLWLGGLPARVLDAYAVNSLLSLVTPTDPQLQSTPERSPLLQIRSRNGLSASAQLAFDPPEGGSPLEVGQLVRESVRVLPRNPSLIVALDTNLERIERVDATSAFAIVPSVSPAPALDRNADCLFGRVRETLLAQTPTAALPSLAPSSYGLFSLGEDLIPDTVGEGGEAVKAAVRRLVPHLQTLLAAKLWRMTANEGSSGLRVAAALEIVEGTQPQVLVERESLRGALPTGSRGVRARKGSEVEVLNLSAGSRIQYRLRNLSDRPVYYLLLGLDNRGRAIAGGICEAIAKEVAQTPSSPQSNVILPGETVTIPSAESASAWVLRGAPGRAETQIICASAPFTKTLAALAGEMRPRGDGLPISVLSNPLPVAQSLLQDLHQASAPAAELAGISTDAYALDVNAWATLSFIYKLASG